MVSFSLAATIFGIIVTAEATKIFRVWMKTTRTNHGKLKTRRTRMNHWRKGGRGWKRNSEGTGSLKAKSTTQYIIPVSRAVGRSTHRKCLREPSSRWNKSHRMCRDSEEKRYCSSVQNTSLNVPVSPSRKVHVSCKRVRQTCPNH